jgi:hypothetical protein
MITLEAQTYNKFLKRDGEVKCIQCGDNLPRKARAFSRTSGRRQSNVHKVLYCIPCAKELYFIE